MSRSIPAAAVLALCAALPAAAGEKPAPKFTKKPAAKVAGGKVRIEFAVDRATDVAVYVLDARGKIVRHLVAGVLGRNAPAPLQANSLSQSVEWDRKDDLGKPAAGGPFKARVAAGLKVSYAGTVFSKKTGPNNIVNVLGMATAPDGRLYVLSHRWRKYVAFSTAVHVFRRDGSYERTIKPFAANLSAKRVKATGAFLTPKEGLVPLIYRSIVKGPSYYPNHDVQHQPVVTPDGRLVLAVAPCNLAVLDSDGGIPNKTYAGPRLGKKGLTGPMPNSTGGVISFNIPYLAASRDGKKVFLTGIGNVKFIRNVGRRAFNDHALYSVPFPARGPAKVAFGDPAVAGKDKKHLKDPRGVALDGKGHILVADFGNDRVVVINQKDMTTAGSFPVKAPFWVGANAKNGEIYVGAERTALIKFSGWQKPKEVARTDFKALLMKVKKYYRAGVPLHLALDTSGKTPVLWAACGSAPLRLEDKGAAFSDAQPIGAYGPPNPWNLSVDPLRREVACQGNGVRILNEKSGKITTSGVPNFSGQGFLMRLGLNGQVYAQPPGYKLQRFDRKGKRIPFPATAADKKLKGALNNGPEGTTYWPRDFCVDRRGNIYVKNRGKEYHGLMTVAHYGPEGSLKRTVIWATTDGAMGPKVDTKGNLYMAECVKPLAQPYPEIFKGRLIAGTKDGSSGFKLHTNYGSMDQEYVWMYGSVIKYGPKGGAVWFPKPAVQPFDGKPKLDAALPKVKVLGSRGSYLVKGTELQGALWMRPGYAYLADMSGRGTDRCHCTASDFDVDDFGRTFYPNQGLFRVEVLDTNGNRILNVGGYGNQDYCGPDSYVLDPAGKFLRPRQTSDPKGLVSPFAKPEMAFNWFVGMAVSDRYLYVADGVNRRVLRGKLDYAVDETCSIR